MTTLLWLRQDLRLLDNPALYAAAARGAVLPVYILDDESAGEWKLGGASRWWLHHSLASLKASLAKHSIPLILKRGNPQDILDELLVQTGADSVMWNRCYEPYATARDAAIKTHLKAKGVLVESFNAALLFEPWEIKNQQGNFFKVFTPFWKHCLSKLPPSAPLPLPPRLSAPATLPASDGLDDWGLLPTKPDWARGLRDTWQVGEDAAQTQLKKFLNAGLMKYDGGRDIPSQDNTSRLSPHLHFGEISPRQIWYQVSEYSEKLGSHVSKYLAEIGWREFSYHLLFHVPTLPSEPFNTKFSAFTWDFDERSFNAWKTGQTGYPLVDAGMRELWHTGIMHNRVRMVTASFLTKHLRFHWKEGEDWFWDTLVDADLASNAASWQWVAGCGADAAPYFRIFNPFTQSEKFDPQGDYIRKWVPELRDVSPARIHMPWAYAPRYPKPIVEHDAARKRALNAYAALKDAVPHD
jgi:deoxyribodipyrimidine photo-lyase